MQTYIVLLRGINVSGTKKIKMADLKIMFVGLGFSEVVTYIQSGNVVLKSEEENIQELELKIKKGIEDVFGYDVPVLVKTTNEIADIIDESPYTNEEDLAANRIYYVLLKSAPSESDIEGLEQNNYPNELFTVTDTCVYLNCKNGAGKAKLTNNVIERKLKVQATSRNHRTMLKLIELSASL